LKKFKSGSTQSNLAEILKDPTQLNFAKFWSGPTLPHSTNFCWGRLNRIRHSVGVNSTEFRPGKKRPNFDWA